MSLYLLPTKKTVPRIVQWLIFVTQINNAKVSNVKTKITLEAKTENIELKSETILNKLG